MNTWKIRIAALMLAAGLSGTAQAELQGRDLNGSAGSFEAYYDTVLDITWLANANYGAGSSYDDGYSASDGRMSWANANTWAANLSIVDAVNNISYDNWRLPTVNPANGTSFVYGASYDGSTDVGWNITGPNSEMAYMFYVNLGNPSLWTLTGNVSGCYVAFTSTTCLKNKGPFSNLQSYLYWSATEYAPGPNSAWSFYMPDGRQYFDSKTESFHAWAVSPGDVGTATASVPEVPEADTWAMLLAGFGLVWVAVRRRKGA